MTKIIRRTFQFLDKDAFLLLYKTMIRTHLDYAIAVWYPYKKNIIAIENVQRRATKELPGMRNFTYIERLKLFKLPSLSYRCLRGDMTEVLNIIHNLCNIESSPQLLKWEDASLRTGNRGHTKIIYSKSKNKYKKKCFSHQSDLTLEFPPRNSGSGKIFKYF